MFFDVWHGWRLLLVVVGSKRDRGTMVGRRKAPPFAKNATETLKEFSFRDFSVTRRTLVRSAAGGDAFLKESSVSGSGMCSPARTLALYSKAFFK
jgi:hypothetical protein